MTLRLPLVVIAGQVQQLPAGDTIPAGGSDPTIGSFAPGSFTIPTGKFAVIVDELILGSIDVVTLEGTSCLRVL